MTPPPFGFFKPWPDPKTLSDEELSRICERAPGEDVLLGLGCLGVPVTLLATFIAAVIYGTGAKPLPALLALTTAVLFLAYRQVRLPQRRYREELDYRCGNRPDSTDMAEAEAALATGQADWAFLFKVRGLPHGNFRWLRVTLTEGPPPAAQASLRISGEKLPVFKRIDGPLPDAEAKALLAFAAALDPATLTAVPQFVFDGSPCWIAVLRREPRIVATASGNLAAMELDPSCIQHPTYLACSMLRKIANSMVQRE